jgi:phosphoglycerol transferase MdoB-like AlkP superfamily enzyme
MVQAESFFDVRRLDFGLGEDRVPHFSALMDECVLHGRLAVPCWGANTVRTEFAVLTGIEPASLGLDRFNPYERFARAPVDSIAWKLRASGYTTICVHPFDTRFYDRRRVLPQLGFDRFVGPEAFSRPAPGAYVSDHEVAAEVSRLLAQNGKLVFIFVITMQTHGPWLAPKIDRRPRRMTPGGGVLQGYLTAVQNADAALPEFRQEVQAADGILAIYGDHQPSLPRLAALGIDTTETDYLIWDSRRGIPRRRDLRAAQLSEAVQAIAMRPRLRLLQEAG